MNNFENELAHLLNKYSKEGGSSTPDFILARYLCQCLASFDMVMRERRSWYSDKSPHPTLLVVEPK